ncbi:Peptidyl-prolyl cis-trans isomerase D [Andreprevotia sp. IGB-42]|uniref:SurA N-terminal domain-containing protein n=1 Tax=Andreprevotia sp. IGB-42 TaxID=2497473 RepID=UPI00135CE82E|nr:SurA N-terminal domain-containing protein [Andreprevotia sp. IGB-42]KAF0815248.1 Peptidyl-prolyl cis-trans isomerase D [Andreprevotia sp. IGB-42]
MFDFVERNKTAVQILLGLVALGLVATAGVAGLDAFQGRSTFLAKVGGTEITERELAEAAQGRPVSEAMKPMLLDQLVQQHLMLAQARKLHFGASPQQLQETISAIPAFQENGQFSPKRYQELLAAQQMTATQFEKRVRDDLASRQLLSSFMLSGIPSNATVDRIAKLTGEKREVTAVLISPADYLVQATVSDAEVKAYYDKNQAEFKAPELVKLEYLTLSQAALADAQTISDDDVQKYFNEHQKELTREQRKAAHILIASPKGAPAEEQKAARAKAEDILKQVKANPAKFAELAKANSDDKGSGENGGDLGWFDDSVQFVPEFKTAALKLGKGEVSGLVQTQFGYHIIRVDDIKTKTLADVKPEIVAKVKQQKAQLAFQSQVEKFNETVYQQADSLKPAADAFKLQVQTSGWVSKTNAQEPQLNNPKLLEAAFSDDVLTKKHNTEGIEVAPGTLIAARVIEHKPAQQTPLAQVSADIQAKLKQEKAFKLAAADGAKKLAALQKGENVQLKWTETRELSRIGERSVEPKTLAALFAAPADKLPAYASGEVPGQGYVIYKAIKAVPAPALTAETRKRLVDQLAQAYGQAEMQNYVNGLKRDIKVEYGSAVPPPQAAAQP